MSKLTILNLICLIVWILLLIWDISNCILGNPASWTSLIGSEFLLVLYFLVDFKKNYKKDKERKK